MPYDEDLANRVRELLADEDGITEKKMFGGLAFLLNGHMSVSASGKGGLLGRLDPAEGGWGAAPGGGRAGRARVSMSSAGRGGGARWTAAGGWGGKPWGRSASSSRG